MKDEQNPAYLFSGTDTQLLSLIVKGEIDPVLFAKRELSNRGLNDNGEWIGFDDANKELENYFKKCVFFS